MHADEIGGKIPGENPIVGPMGGTRRHLKVFNRIVTWHGEKGFACEADPRHVEPVIEQLGLQEAKIISTLGTRDEGITKDRQAKACRSKQTDDTEAVSPDSNQHAS